MALKRYKDAVEIQKDDAIKRNQVSFDFMLRMFNHLNKLFVKEKSLLILIIQYIVITLKSVSSPLCTQ